MLSAQNTVLFCEGDLSATLEANRGRLRGLVDGIDQGQFLNSSIDTLVEHIVGQLAVEPIEIFRDRVSMEQAEATLDVSNDYMRGGSFDGRPLQVPGVRVTISIPYVGEPVLWKLTPSSYTTVYPHGKIRSPGNDGIGFLDIFIEQPSDRDQAEIKSALDRELQLIEQYLGWQRPDIEQVNAALAEEARRLVEARRLRLRQQSGLSDLLGIPLKRRKDTPDLSPLGITRQQAPTLPPAPEDGYQDEPGIADEDYERILQIIRHVGRTFETTPGTYAVHDEEELRDIILANLNGHFEGTATGETFRKNGKTDIRIEDEGRAAFVGECKIWRGAVEIKKALDQLLGYLTWRDCKCALIAFNKHNAQFTDLLGKVPAALLEHGNFRREQDVSHDGEWRMVFKSAEDPAREIRLHVFLFNIYVPPTE